MKQTLTQERLKELLHYDPITGIFTRKRSKGAAKAGSIAGALHNKGYLEICIDYNRYLAHRLAWFYVHGEWPEQVDHKDHIRKNNPIENLRAVTNAINCKNISIGKKNTSGVMGVCWHKQAGKWMAQINAGDEYYYLGLFIEKWDAICARKSAEYKHSFHVNHGNPK